MLSLETPFEEIDGLEIYRDHAVPTLFYYAAPHPQIAKSGGRTMFDLNEYSVELEHSPLAGTSIPAELGAGFLTMGVECVLASNKINALRRKIAERNGLPEDNVQISPIPYQKGNVRILALDQYSVPEDAANDPAASPVGNRPRFVEKVIGSASPALLGDLRAIFSLSLSQEGVTFLEGLFLEKAAPIGIVYELEFYGLRPAVEARITSRKGMGAFCG